MGRVAVVVSLVLVVLGCTGAFTFPAPRAQDPVSLADLEVTEAPPLEAGVAIEPGITMSEVVTPHGTTLWVYTPDEAAAPRSRPVVLIGPAGSTLLEGMGLSESDRPEHLPWARAGFVVVAYSIDGARADGEAAHERFAASKGGLLNALEAKRVLRHVPAADLDHVYAVGHSSAGDLALLVGSHLDVAGVVAFNTAGEGCWFQEDAVLSVAALADDHFVRFCQETRAAGHIGHLEAPVLLFGSVDDTVVPLDDVRGLYEALRAAGVEVELVEGTGDHYASMIEQGVPRAIGWAGGGSAAGDP